MLRTIWTSSAKNVVDHIQCAIVDLKINYALCRLTSR